MTAVTLGSMKVWIATSGEYDDYRICHVFARQEDAESYPGGDDVTEYEVREAPVEMRPWHILRWIPPRDWPGDSQRLANPHESSSWPRDYLPGRPDAAYRWHGPPQRTGPVLEVEGWDLDLVRKVYSEQRARYLAHPEVHAGAAKP